MSGKAASWLLRMIQGFGLDLRDLSTVEASAIGHLLGAVEAVKAHDRKRAREQARAALKALGPKEA